MGFDRGNVLAVDAAVAQRHGALGAANRRTVKGQQPIVHFLCGGGRHRVKGGTLQAGNVVVFQWQVCGVHGNGFYGDTLL